MSEGLGPYRGGTRGKWVCLVCYRQLSSYAGLCPTCEVDLLSLEDPAVREELRAEAERRMQKRMYSEYFGLSLLGFVLAMPTLEYLGMFLYVVAALVIGQAGIFGWAMLRPGSALGLYAARRRRLAATLAGRPEVAALPAHEGKGDKEEGDPEDLGIDATLAWLGMEEKKK